jgi:hypothetical protein
MLWYVCKLVCLNKVDKNIFEQHYNFEIHDTDNTGDTYI